MAVQVVQPGGQRCRTEPRGQRTAHLARVGIDVDGALLVLLGELGHGQHDLGGVVRCLGRDDRGDAALGVSLTGGRYLLGERLRRVTDLLDPQLLAVDELVELRHGRVREPGQRRDEQERGDQDTGVEVQPGQQRPPAGTGTAVRGAAGHLRCGGCGRGGGCGRRGVVGGSGWRRPVRRAGGWSPFGGGGFGGGAHERFSSWSHAGPRRGRSSVHCRKGTRRAPSAPRGAGRTD